LIVPERIMSAARDVGIVEKVVLRIEPVHRLPGCSFWRASS
jgi:hypothetical protein